MREPGRSALALFATARTRMSRHRPQQTDTTGVLDQCIVTTDEAGKHLAGVGIVEVDGERLLHGEDS